MTAAPQEPTTGSTASTDLEDDFVADRRADIDEDAFELGDSGREGYHGYPS